MSTHPIRDLIMFAIGMLIVGGLALLMIWDLLQSRRPDGRTISKRALEIWKRQQSNPAFWICWMLPIGFAIGFVIGFVAGHLAWPQTP